MSAIQMNVGYDALSVALPCAFIDRYVTRCKPVYALIYIYCLRQCIGGSCELSSQAIGDAFRILETDVLNALKFWENEQLMHLTKQGDTITVTFRPISITATAAAGEATAEPGGAAANPGGAAANPGEAIASPGGAAANPGEATASPGRAETAPGEATASPGRAETTPGEATTEPGEAATKPGEATTTPGEATTEPGEATTEPGAAKGDMIALRNARPQYTVDELTVYKSQSKDIERLFHHAEQALGKLLTYHDMVVIFGFYDWLRLPTDVIMYLLSYCTDKGRRDLRYIEKTALDWSDNEIDSVEKALDHVQTVDVTYKPILQVLGQTTGYPTPTQLQYLQKWLDTYDMPVEIVLQACDKSAVQIGKPTFTYVDKILEDWHNKGIRTMEGVRADASAFAAQKAETGKSAKPRTETQSRATKPKNRFANFDQRERDYAQLEKLEREYLIQSLKG